MPFAHNNELYVPSRQLIGFENSFAGASTEDVDNLAGALWEVNAGPKDWNPEPVHAMRAAQGIHGPSHDLVIRSAVRDGIELLIHVAIQPEKNYPRNVKTLSEQEDLALIKTQRALLSMTDEKWQELSLRLGRSTSDVRQETWSRIFKTYRQHD